MSNLALQPTQIVTQMGTVDSPLGCTAASDWCFPLFSVDIKNGWNCASTYTETILLYRFPETLSVKALK